MPTVTPVGGVVRPGDASHHQRRRAWRRNSGLYVLLAPSLVLVAVFAYYPAGKAVVNALFDGSYGRMGNFVGLENFARLAGDPVFHQAVANMAIFTLVTALLSTVIPLFIAETIFWLASERAKSVYRVLVMWPVIVPGVVTLLIWQFIYDGDSGMLNSLLGAIGLGHLQTSWLGNISTALWAVIFTGFPWVSGLAVLIYLAGLKDIEKEVFDAGAVDGIAGFRRFWHLDRPLLNGQIRLNFILSVIGGTQAFVAPLVLTQGGPANATMVPGLYLYRAAFMLGQLGYASAIGVTLFILILVLTALFNTILRNQR
ncbi:MAG: sugar ABC transporter permease [Propionicimonas sp.]|uniref:carbohydrate ABC transporter permease n=1 Tax=Propionicimonas sp. TaxID=1955623 RepID=UPI002B1F2A51|nr:sugar ABC transporter permease [Propionicimonas sp.]MEA4945170.1 sugar ABC transporter permease [Propionicimonas sp.]